MDVMIIYIKIDGGFLWGEACDEEDQGYDIELLWDQQQSFLVLHQ